MNKSQAVLIVGSVMHRWLLAVLFLVLALAMMRSVLEGPANVVAYVETGYTAGYQLGYNETGYGNVWRSEWISDMVRMVAFNVRFVLAILFFILTVKVWPKEQGGCRCG